MYTCICINTYTRIFTYVYKYVEKVGKPCCECKFVCLFTLSQLLTWPLRGIPHHTASAPKTSPIHGAYIM